MKREFEMDQLLAIAQRERITPNGFAHDDTDIAAEWRRFDVGSHHTSDWQVSACVEFLRQLPLVGRPHFGSYYLKHLVERWADAYVCNGALLVAAFHLDMPVEREAGRSPNGSLSIGARSRWPDALLRRMSARPARY